jgi:hypothetical protein
MLQKTESRYILMPILWVSLCAVLSVPTSAQKAYKEVKPRAADVYCNVYVEQDMPQQQIDYLWDTYGWDSLARYCFVREFQVEYTNNFEFVTEFLALLPPQSTLPGMIPREKYHLLGPRVVAFLEEVETVNRLSTGVRAGWLDYDERIPDDTSKYRFNVDVSSDSYMSLSHILDAKERLRTGALTPNTQTVRLEHGGCGELASVPNTESHTTEEPAIVRAVGVAPPMGTDAGQPFVIIDVRGRIVHSGTTTGGPSSDVIPLPAGVYAVITSTTRQRVLVVP